MLTLFTPLIPNAPPGLMQRPHQQIVILSQVLVDDVNTGFQQMQNLQVRSGSVHLQVLHAAGMAPHALPCGLVASSQCRLVLCPTVHGHRTAPDNTLTV